MWDKYERRRLKKIANSLKEDNSGLIIRTVAEGKSEEQLTNDYKDINKKMAELWKTRQNGQKHRALFMKT